ncbi:MAG TPA: YciI family protein [Steroidobacteraceae bacterium]
MKYVMLIYQGTTPLPGTDAWKAVPEAEQKAIYTDYQALNKAPGVTPGLPLGLPGAAKTVQVRGGKPQIKNGTYLAEGAGGYLVFEADNMDAAVALAARIPAAARGALPALIDGEPGAVWAVGGQVRAAFLFIIGADKISEIELIMDPAHLSTLDVKID